MLVRKIIWTEEPIENPAENPEKIEKIFGDGYDIRDYYADRLPYFISMIEIDKNFEYELTYCADRDDYLNDVFQKCTINILSLSEPFEMPDDEFFKLYQ